MKRDSYPRRVLHTWTYLIYRFAMMKLFPRTHPWRRRDPFTLREWARDATKTNDNFALVFWWSVVQLAVFILIIVKNHV